MQPGSGLKQSSLSKGLGWCTHCITGLLILYFEKNTSVRRVLLMIEISYN